MKFKIFLDTADRHCHFCYFDLFDSSINYHKNNYFFEIFKTKIAQVSISKISHMYEKFSNIEYINSSRHSILIKNKSMTCINECHDSVLIEPYWKLNRSKRWEIHLKYIEVSLIRSYAWWLVNSSVSIACPAFTTHLL